MSLRFAVTILTIVLIAVGAGIGVFVAKGYRFFPKEATFTGTGIMSVTSLPDQASVYLDDHLTTATNANVNSLVPKTYKVKIVKEGFIPWEKNVEVKEGLVSDIKATLFPAIPTIYPLTFNGVINPTLSPDGQQLVFVVPGEGKKSGIWVWTFASAPIAFAREVQPHQIALPVSGLDYTKAIFKFSPDSNQVLVTLPDRTLLLDADNLNDTPRDVTAILQPTLKEWEEEVNTKNIARVQAIKDLSLKKVASASSNLIWSPDGTKFLLPDFKIADLVDKKIHSLPEANFAAWLPDSRHILLIKQNESNSSISVVEYDGFNEAIIYVGNFDPEYVFAWPDGLRVAIVTSFPTPTAEQPNLYGINLK